MLRASAFLGRAAEQAHLAALLDAGPVVTVSGPGGVGKTRLVHETVAARGDADVVVADLEVLPAGADVCALSGLLRYESPEAAAAALGARRALLVLDSCEHVLEAVRSLLVPLLREPGVRVVTTSREPLGVPGERVVVLGPLPLPPAAVDVDVEDSPAVQLFLDRAASAGAAWPRTAESLTLVGELCRRLDGLPLAIELAAARTRALGPRELLAAASERVDLLRRPGAPADHRHGSVAAALQLSLDLLTEEERATHLALSVFRGPFDVDLATAVAAPPGADRLHVVDLLTRLVDRSLVVATHDDAGTRFRQLELVRDHAAQALRSSGGWDEARERWADAMAAAADRAVVEGLEGWSPALLAWISSQVPNLLAATGWCVERDPDAGRAHRLLLPLFSPIHESRAPEVLAAGRAVLERWPDADVPWRAEALAVLATAAALSGRFDEAAGLADLGERAGGTAVAAMVRERAVGLVLRASGDPSGAAARFDAGRRAAEGLGARSFARELAGLTATALIDAGRPHDAAAVVDDLVTEAAADGDAITEAWGRLVASAVLLRDGRWDDAEEQVELARACTAGAGTAWWEGIVLRQRAVLAACRAGDAGGPAAAWAASAERWRQALDAAVHEGSTGLVAELLRAAVAVARRLGDDDRARRLLAAVPATTEISVMPEPFPCHTDDVTTAGPPGAGHDLAAAIRAARALLVDAGPAAGGSPAQADRAPHPARLRHEDGGWLLTYAGRISRVRDLKGVADLAMLLARPGREVHCLELMGGVDAGGAPGPGVDDRARRAYEERIRDLQDDIEEARRHHDPGRAERAEVELDALVAQLEQAFGLGGRQRGAGSSAERARTAIAYRIRTAVRRIADVHPELGRHLENAVRTGTWCSYRPETDVVWEIVGPEAAQAARSR